MAQAEGDTAGTQPQHRAKTPSEQVCLNDMSNEPKKQSKWLSVGLVIFLLLLFAIQASDEVGDRFKQLLVLGLGSRISPPSTTFEIAVTSPRFEHLWTTPDVFANYRRGKGGIHLATVGEHVFLLGSVGENKIGSLSLTKISLLTGDTEWNKFEPFERNRGDASTIGVTSDFVYIGFEGVQKISGETTWGASQIVAYKSDTGHRVWSTAVPGARSIDSMIVTGSTVSVNGNFSSSYHLYSAETGAMLDARIKEEGNFIWFIDNNISYEESKTATFQAVDKQTGALLWQTTEYFGVYQPPILTKNAIVARSGEARFSGTVFAVDQFTGNLLWQYEDVLSNVAVTDSTAFFLTKNVQLVAVDISNGKIVGKVSFTPDWVDDPVNSAFYVASNAGIVVVYFGDSRQLFAFRLSPS